MKPKFTEEEQKLIGRHIRDSRNAKKYTIEQLAEIIECSPKHNHLDLCTYEFEDFDSSTLCFTKFMVDLVSTGHFDAIFCGFYVNYNLKFDIALC